jgi:acyl carrier protein
MRRDPPVIEQIRDIFEDVLHIEPPGPDVDLIATRGLDSLAILELLAELEARFRIEIPLDDLDLDMLRTMARIARFVERCMDATAHAAR